MTDNLKIKPLLACVSLGPGDPELITLKALRLINEAEIIFCPATKSGENKVSRANDILLELGIDPQKIHLFSVPMSKDRSLAQKIYNDVAHEIARQWEQGTHVAFVAEGDSGFYSSVHYISDELHKMGIIVTHIAGVPAFIACGALAGIHIVKQNEPLLILPSETSEKEIITEILGGKSVVLMKLSKQENLVKAIIKTLPDVQFLYFENVGIVEKEYYTDRISDILNRSFPYFSLLIIRKKD